MAIRVILQDFFFTIEFIVNYFYKSIEEEA
jgi:hypothetical protein